VQQGYLVQIWDEDQNLKGRAAPVNNESGCNEHQENFIKQEEILFSLTDSG
jgi:hypothetical protein